MGVFLLFFGGFFFGLLMSSISEGCFLGGSGRGYNAEEGRRPPMQRILLAHGEAATKNGNKSILPSWLQLDPDSL